MGGVRGTGRHGARARSACGSGGRAGGRGGGAAAARASSRPAMLALYRCGRQAEALEAYRGARTTLVEEIGASRTPSCGRCRRRSSPRTPRSTLRRAWRICRPGWTVVTGAGGPGRRACRARGARRRRVSTGAAAWLRLGSARIGKTRLGAGAGSRSAAAPDGGALTGGADALAAVSEATGSDRATLLIVDDADDADVEVLERAAASSARRRLLVLVLHRGPSPRRSSTADCHAGSCSARSERRGGRDRFPVCARRAKPLPVDSLAAESGGVPLAVHRVARDWARARASAAIGASPAAPATSAASCGRPRRSCPTI